MLNCYSINSEKVNSIEADVSGGKPSGTIFQEQTDGGEALQWSCESPFFNCAITASVPYLPSAPVPFYLKLYQENPRRRSSDPRWRSYTHSLQSYENAMRKQYIIMMLNFECTHRVPDFHVVVGFHVPMAIKEFTRIRNEAFGRLAKGGVRAFYVHEPGKKGWLHIHGMVSYDGAEDVLRVLIKKAFGGAGLKYRQDFHVKVKPAIPTFAG
jgi:hypothetical protein